MRHATHKHRVETFHDHRHRQQNTPSYRLGIDPQSLTYGERVLAGRRLSSICLSGFDVVVDCLGLDVSVSLLFLSGDGVHGGDRRQRDKRKML